MGVGLNISDDRPIITAPELLRSDVNETLELAMTVLSLYRPRLFWSGKLAES
jgi:hypothetical protein